MRSDVSSQVSKIVFKAIKIILMILTGVFQTVSVLLVGIGGAFLKAVAALLVVGAVLMCFLTSFSGWNAMIVILTATVIFWLPEVVGVFLGCIVFLQRRFLDFL